MILLQQILIKSDDTTYYTGRKNKADREATNLGRERLMMLTIPFYIQEDAEEARRKRRRHTLTYVEEHSDTADKGRA
jgi:hypothetical protein